MAPARQMVPALGKDDRLTARLRYLNGFRILSYNVLAEIYATRQMYPYCPMWALNWSFRKQLLQRELQLYNADILCLQEVQADHYKHHFQPMMAAWGYDGLFQKKTRESMGLEGKVDGCATFYRTSRYVHQRHPFSLDHTSTLDRFFLKEQYAVEFNEAATDFVASLWSNFELAYPTASNQEPSLSRVRQRLVRDNVAQIVVLDVAPLNDTTTAGRKAPLPSICVTNVHIFSNPEFPDVKLWQTHTLLDQIEHLAHSRRVPVIVCGDFNSEPSSAVYSLLSQNHVRSDHPDLKTLSEFVHMNKLTHPMTLQSAYAAVFGTEPAYTNYTGSWVGVVDYIWFSVDALVAVAGLEVHPPDVLQAYARTCLPNCQYSSDHVPMCIDFCFKGMPTTTNNAGRY
ncbi:hypothetical protein DYB32_006216 [Aphanomyces invadans]|uniref:Endonuclease/exonuclease/phosphatase domain-containing protein n=1 Tax=Aphanomyces invadans TaxID=157072 RepID=A0A418AYR0_9STRA|nr:hypothetical protein DYB32_006216 [Aphanomyces invadans]